MSEVVLKLPHVITEERLLEQLLDSGADVWSWWSELDQVRVDETMHFCLRGDDDGMGNEFSALVSVADAVRILQSVIDENKPGARAIVTAFMNEDFDADISDIALQYLAFGSVVFG